MKLLFDENLSPQFPKRLGALYSNSIHVRDIGLKGADDITIWEHAAAHGFILVTKDDDFLQISVLRGCPPKLVIIGAGNCPSSAIESLFRAQIRKLEEFERDPSAFILELR